MLAVIFVEAIILIALVWGLIKTIGSMESSDAASGIGGIMLIGLIILGLFVVIVIQIVGISLDDVDDMAGVNIPIVLIILGLVVGMFALVKWRPLPSRTQSDEPTPDDSVVDRDQLEVTTSRSKRLKQQALEKDQPYIESVDDYDQHFESDSHSMGKPTYISNGNEYISNGYTLVSEDISGYSGVVIGGNTLELRHNNVVVNTVTIELHPADTFTERAQKIYDDLLDEALANEN